MNKMKIGCVGILWFVLGLTIGGHIDISYDLEADNPAFAPLPIVKREYHNPALFPFKIFDARLPMVKVPSLQEMASGAQSDHQVIARVMTYYRDKKAILQERWQEIGRDRLKALFAMYVIHISHPYGTAQSPVTFTKYVKESRTSKCDTYGIFQSRILDAFGLTWRYVAISSGFHGWIEVDINGHWEIFDSTVNVWIDRSAFDLLDGRERRYRLFYTPWSDINRPNARAYQAGLKEPLFATVGALRLDMLGMGIYFMTKKYLRDEGLRVEVWENFRAPES